jgi:terminal uridylyltransferase
VKLTLDPSPGLPHGIACDIGFENRLALENTRLLMCYAMIDPTRVRTLVLFRMSLLLSLCAGASSCRFSQGLEQETVSWPRLSATCRNLKPFQNSKINSPYKGTLSSYGYVLLVIYFLVHVKNPPVLPNLQQMPPLRPISQVGPRSPSPFIHRLIIPCRRKRI